ncbi:hypothetical protein CJF39_18260 [Pseudomonas lundensis]|uniref:Uncharacterized protein n=1 Tax=Pseudomonas lundensis TaxID=86185 RepID=A0A266N680_9PSED|nr:hypothetical protein CJF39_18260 [Pseudomonas lundensis]
MHIDWYSRLHWDLFDRLVRFEDNRLRVDYAYDPLGRRLYKYSNAHHPHRNEAGSQWNQNEQARKQRELGCGFTLFGWDGDTLAWESSPAQADGASGKTVHYLYEPGSFVPVAQALRHQPMRLLAQPSYTGAYDIDQDPLWTHTPQALPIDVLAWYQCDHLGTPQELTDHTGQIAWSAQYKAWGEVKEQRSEWAQRQGLKNPIRFQGQYHDHETGLHYNRYRYYDPRAGRFVSKDPISYAGGLNLYAYAPNPVEWVDALGLSGRRGAFKQAKRDARVPVSQQPDSIVKVPMTTRGGCPVICDGKRVETREYMFAREDGSKVVIQDHSAGHNFGEGGIGDQNSHFNVRPQENTRTGSVPGTAAHYPFGRE